MAKNQPQQQNKKPSKYFNFGVGWLFEETGILNCVVNWERNSKANKGTGYKLYLVPVDSTGAEDTESAIEVTQFRVKQVERTNKTPENAPDYQVYAWE